MESNHGGGGITLRDMGAEASFLVSLFLAVRRPMLVGWDVDFRLQHHHVEGFDGRNDGF